jgi:hypothetical protein
MSAAETSDALALSRTGWMSTTAKQIYEDYFAYLVDITPVEPVERAEFRPRAQGLMIIARDVATRFIDSEAASDELSPLIGHEAEILHYTSADEMEFIAHSDDPDTRVRSNNVDSLIFANKITVGMALDVLTSLDCVNYTTLFQAAATILRNEHFGEAIDVFATTGFGILGPSVPAAGNFGNDDYAADYSLRRLKRALGFPTNKRAVLRGSDVTSIPELLDVDISVDPVFQKGLLQKLREQNHDVRHGAGRDLQRYEVVKRHNKKSGFSRGCPVAHGPTFGLLRNYLADVIDATALDLGY